ncbi:PREDICTED: uncharacterized protein LOC106811024 [Priapulus caudatus]|uniref:Uncharacterized protein LOC106811024 n=1 Tax=Priapulus caudatus TaxID=37621 RepID=A0ABM1ECV6_PRICU|nr:PREDICTED: uncharacterized protein LOC106811024 [Priapulus caudatus]
MQKNLCPEQPCPGPEQEQKCVKIIDNSQYEKKVVRGCLWDLRSSNWKMYLPADTFSGCRRGSNLYDDAPNSQQRYRSSHETYSETGSSYRDRLEHLDICLCDDWNHCNAAVVARRPAGVGATTTLAMALVVVGRWMW